jgi:hypothetical protein
MTRALNALTINRIGQALALFEDQNISHKVLHKNPDGTTSREEIHYAPASAEAPKEAAKPDGINSGAKPPSETPATVEPKAPKKKRSGIHQIARAIGQAAGAGLAKHTVAWAKQGANERMIRKKLRASGRSMDPKDIKAHAKQISQDWAADIGHHGASKIMHALNPGAGGAFRSRKAKESSTPDAGQVDFNKLGKPVSAAASEAPAAKAPKAPKEPSERAAAFADKVKSETPGTAAKPKFTDPEIPAKKQKFTDPEVPAKKPVKTATSSATATPAPAAATSSATAAPVPSDAHAAAAASHSAAADAHTAAAHSAAAAAPAAPTATPEKPVYSTSTSTAPASVKSKLGASALGAVKKAGSAIGATARKAAGVIGSGAKAAGNLVKSVGGDTASAFKSVGKGIASGAAKVASAPGKAVSKISAAKDRLGTKVDAGVEKVGQKIDRAKAGAGALASKAKAGVGAFAAKKVGQAKQAASDMRQSFGNKEKAGPHPADIAIAKAKFSNATQDHVAFGAPHSPQTSKAISALAKSSPAKGNAGLAKRRQAALDRSNTPLHMRRAGVNGGRVNGGK